jgi:hypothetical protein
LFSKYFNGSTQLSPTSIQAQKWKTATGLCLLNTRSKSDLLFISPFSNSTVGGIASRCPDYLTIPLDKLSKIMILY